MNFLDGIGFLLEWAFLTFAGSYQQEPAVFWQLVLMIMAGTAVVSKLGDLLTLVNVHFDNGQTTATETLNSDEGIYPEQA